MAKWTPVAFNCWRDPHDELWILSSGKVSPDIVSAAISKSFLDIDFRRAAEHYNGKGLKEGLHIESSLRLLRNFKESSYQDKCVLETI
jgi:hypothetical protein